ncbi:hypothetical protein GCM10011583_48150 [Streptomyces camponoticapitis]|uniref:Uncharacterized protein n=1 Tax=Streptomyces camponoticapitis TaxID=1616125 RepID=A0ABQ2EJ61_9ACTN|nr:hypothetical protein GCM10011583_48150 [Streptomyces camponoticapitis]
MLALAGPPGDRGGDPVLQVVGVSGDGDGAAPILRYRLHLASFVVRCVGTPGRDLGRLGRRAETLPGIDRDPRETARVERGRRAADGADGVRSKQVGNDRCDAARCPGDAAGRVTWSMQMDGTWLGDPAALTTLALKAAAHDVDITMPG